MKNILLLILCFTLLFVAFHPEYKSPSGLYGTPSFSDIFGFGYELTFGTLEVVVSIFDGPSALIARFTTWRKAIFGDNTIISYLDTFTDKLPIVRTLKNFAEFVIQPLEDVFIDLSEWIRNKLD